MHDSRLDIQDDDFQDSVSDFYDGVFNYLYNDIALTAEEEMSFHIDSDCSPDQISITYVDGDTFEFESVEDLIVALKEHEEYKKLNMTPQEIETAFDEYENRIAQMKVRGRNWQD